LLILLHAHIANFLIVYAVHGTVDFFAICPSWKYVHLTNLGKTVHFLRNCLSYKPFKVKIRSFFKNVQGGNAFNFKKKKIIHRDRSRRKPFFIVEFRSSNRYVQDENPFLFFTECF
jgi:hypothetical protein